MQLMANIDVRQLLILDVGDIEQIIQLLPVNGFTAKNCQRFIDSVYKNTGLSNRIDPALKLFILQSQMKVDFIH